VEECDGAARQARLQSHNRLAGHASQGIAQRSGHAPSLFRSEPPLYLFSPHLSIAEIEPTYPIDCIPTTVL
jgi:hypothetical protein